MIKDFKPRLYQETILNASAQKNTLVVLPTGMGKTAIALMLAAQRTINYPKSKVLFLAPTKPLVEQHMRYFMKYLDDEESAFTLFTGAVKPEKREILWKESKFVFSTPQGLENDVISGKINLAEVSLIVFDEAHRGVGDYAYVYLAKEYEKRAKYPRILALTASPGSETKHIKEVCDNLFIEGIEIRTEEDPDVKPYVQEVSLEWLEVDLPKEFTEIKDILTKCYKSKLESIKSKGYLKRTDMLNRKDLIDMQRSFHAELAIGVKDFLLMQSISLLAEAMKIQHALELLETQGINPLNGYFETIYEQSSTSKVKAVKNLAADPLFKTAFIKTTALFEKKTEHPKLTKLKEIIAKEVNDNPEIKIIIFSHFRDTAADIVKEIEAQGISVRLFVGQAKKKNTGLSQKKQIEILKEFSEGNFNVIVMTSVGEEGLDIPQVDQVVFFEPIPSAIRHIQRKGRTGRLEKGKVKILVTRNTRDVGYRWSAHHKEKRMYATLKSMKEKIAPMLMKKEQPGLDKFIKDSERIKVYADIREKGSGAIKELIDEEVKIELTTLKTGDYIVSDRCGIEIKKVPDFVDSIIDGRLLEQLKNLKQSYSRPIVIVEGKEDIYAMRKIHPNAIRGMLATIAVSYGIPIINSRDSKETGSLLFVIAKREQDENGKDFTPHSEKKVSTLKDQQEYLISALPGVGMKLAKPLLQKFKTVKKLINASEERLKKVDLIGEKKAKSIRDVLEEEYD